VRTLRQDNSVAARPGLAAARDSAPSLARTPPPGRAKSVSRAGAPATVGECFAPHERAVIDAALAIVVTRLRQPEGYAQSPRAARELAMLHLGGLDREGFGVMFLDAQNGLIAFEVLFLGTLTQTSVHPREVARAALRHNAAAVILAHNHPSGVPEPSRADKGLTEVLKLALDLLGVGLLDHLVIAGDRFVSFKERGLL